MNYDLRDYQREAALGVLSRLGKGLTNWRNHGDHCAFALSAITGSGKTVVATAAIEALLHGSPDLGVEADPRVTFLWVTDDPALNRQTRDKMQTASDLLAPARLVVLDNDFLEPELSPGRVYFLNVQKLSKNAGLNHGGNNFRERSMWEVLAATIQSGHCDVVLVLDEAHKGMKPATDRKTIVRKIIDGHPKPNPAVPVVWGISATIDRFDKAMDGTSERDRYTNVEVDTEKVRASGLVKASIGLDDADETGTHSTTLLREAVRDLLDFDRRWATYSEEQKARQVFPALVIQVRDKIPEGDLADMVTVIENEWPDLGPDGIAHVFGEHEPIKVPGRAIRWVPPESIEGDTDIRVVLAKTAISTGWDCPRAEVLYSQRPAEDATHIAQVIGRMVRNPLAEHIHTDDALNSVSCYLPHFERSALHTIKAELEGTGTGGAESETGSAVLRAPITLERNPAVPIEAFDAIESITSLPAPDALANPLRRAKALAGLLVGTAGGRPAMQPGANAALTKTLNNRLAGLAAEYAEAVEVHVTDLNLTDIHRTTVGPFGSDLATSTRQVKTHLDDIDRETRRIIRSVREGVGQDFYAHCVDAADKGADLLDIRIEVAATLMVDGVIETIEARATEWVQVQLAKHDVAIKNTTGATREAFRRVEAQASTPEPVGLELRDNAAVSSRDGDGKPIPVYAGNLYADADGNYPASLNDWEHTVVSQELDRDNFVAWYRNPSRPSPASVRVAYQDATDDWSSLQVDFVFISRRDDDSLGLSIVDPHGDHLADAKPKLLALAAYAEQFGDQFVRIESIAKVDEQLRTLDLLDADVRSAVEAHEGSQVCNLYETIGKTYN